MTNFSELRRRLRAKRPSKITQAPFDYDDAHLRRLLALDPDQRPSAADLCDYTQDLLYSDEIQVDLFHYLLPFALEAWRKDLRGGWPGAFVDWFYPAMTKPRVRAALGPERLALVSAYLAGGILEKIDDQRGLTYQDKNPTCRWIGALSTYGVLFADIERIFAEWWSLRTTGRAVAAIQYLSCLMYEDTDNPIFWVPNASGGPLPLWDFDGHLYEHRWLDRNVVFLENFLRPAALEQLLRQATETLEGLPEYEAASEVLQDWPLCIEVLTARCDELPELLRTEQTAGELLSWTV